MTKADVIAGITAKTGKEKEATGTIIDAFFKVVQSSLINGEDVFVRGFGAFQVKK